jgi:hypothetical protein
MGAQAEHHHWLRRTADNHGLAAANKGIVHAGVRDNAETVLSNGTFSCVSYAFLPENVVLNWLHALVVVFHSQRRRLIPALSMCSAIVCCVAHMFAAYSASAKGSVWSLSDGRQMYSSVPGKGSGPKDPSVLLEDGHVPFADKTQSATRVANRWRTVHYTCMGMYFFLDVSVSLCIFVMIDSASSFVLPQLANDLPMILVSLATCFLNTLIIGGRKRNAWRLFGRVCFLL